MSEYTSFECETAAGRLQGDPDGVVRVLLREDAELVEDDLIALHEAFLQNVDTPRPMLVDTRRIASMTRAARKRAAGGDVIDMTTRLAILVESPISRIIARFFTRVSKPPYPTRIFRFDDEALRWLRDPRA